MEPRFSSQIHDAGDGAETRSLLWKQVVRVMFCLEDTRMRADRGLSVFGRTKTQSMQR